MRFIRGWNNPKLDIQRKANAQKKYTKPQKKILKKRQETVDFDKMTDEELEAWIYNDNEI